MITAIVPMKGKSVRVPGKNLRPLARRPLCWYVLTTLHQAPSVSRIVVDTDSEEIADTVRGYFPDATILDRPAHLRGPEVNGNPLTAWAMSQVEGEYFLQTHVTNPLLTVDSVERAIDAYRDHGMEPGHCTHDSLMAVTEHRSHFYTNAGQPVNHEPGTVQRTQDLAPLLEDNHCLYLFSRASFAESGGRVGRNPYRHRIPRWEAVDIDWPEDFEAAEALLAARMAVAR